MGLVRWQSLPKVFVLSIFIKQFSGSTMKDALLSLRSALGFAYWVRISTESPQCIYYFGPFASSAEAEAHSDGYYEDLVGEAAQNIVVSLQRRAPKELTITEDWGEMGPSRPAMGSPAYSN
jgi:hypothetical protein